MRGSPRGKAAGAARGPSRRAPVLLGAPPCCPQRLAHPAWDARPTGAAGGALACLSAPGSSRARLSPGHHLPHSHSSGSPPVRPGRPRNHLPSTSPLKIALGDVRAVPGHGQLQFVQSDIAPWLCDSWGGCGAGKQEWAEGATTDSRMMGFGLHQGWFPSPDGVWLAETVPGSPLPPSEYWQGATRLHPPHCWELQDPKGT